MNNTANSSVHPSSSTHATPDEHRAAWTQLWQSYKTDSADHTRVRELVKYALSTGGLTPDNYAITLSIFERHLLSDADPLDDALTDAQWVRDYLQSMTGRLLLTDLRARRRNSHSGINRPLRIGIDVRGLAVASTRKRGIGRYVVNLIRQLSALGSSHRLVLLGDEPPWDVQFIDDLLALPNAQYLTYHRFFAREIDVYLMTDPLPLLTGREMIPYPIENTPVAAILYDLIPLAFPSEYLAGEPQLHKQYIDGLRALGRTVDCYLPISEFVGAELEERLGVNPAFIHPIIGGLDEVFDSLLTRDLIDRTLADLSIQDKYFIYAGGFDFRKNLDVLLAAYIHYRRDLGGDAKLVLIGDAFDRWLTPRIAAFQAEAIRKDVICPGFVSDRQLHCLYGGAEAFIFPSLHEGFGLPALEAMASGCPVIVSDSTSLKEVVGDAGLLIDPDSPRAIASAMKRVSTDRELSAELRRRGAQRSKLFTWRDVAKKTLTALQSIAAARSGTVAPERKLSVLVQNRPDAFSARGGDTMVMNQLYASLRDLGVEVNVACGNADLRNVDLVHLVNLTLRNTGMEVAANARAQGVPLAVTTLYEDWPRYLNKSIGVARVFHDYQSSGRSQSVFESGMERIRVLTGSAPVACEEVADYASALITCGPTESRNLSARFPHASEKIREARFAVTDMSRYASPTANRSRFIDTEFVICCGRIETRKNQLMLLKALEDDDIPIVLVGGGFSAQPEYVQLVRSFKRRGPVYILGRLDIRGLATFMNAAAVHVLPSWYELPGLVSLEAATCSTPVVASDWGGLSDYLPPALYHACQPDDPASIRSAVFAAMQSPSTPEAAATAKSFTLQRFGEETLRIYEEILSKRPARGKTAAAVPSKQSSTNRSTSPLEATTMSNRSTAFDVSIIIPVYNQAQMTQRCLEAISTLDCRASYEVIVVDNHSTDETSKLLGAVEGDIKVLREPVNRGFAAACNHGARIADGRCLLFLNNDTEPQAGWIDAMLDCAGRYADVGAIGAKLLYPNGKTQHAGVAFNEEKTPYNLFQNFSADHPAVNEERTMQAVSAACMLVPADVYEDFDGMDESFRNGFEDIDLCLRMKEAGREIVYCPSAVVVHKEESTEGRKNHDAENFELYLSRWENIVRADEAEYTSRFGLKLEWTERGGRYVDAGSDVSTNGSAPAGTLIDEASKRYVAGDYEGAVKVLQQVVESQMVLGNEDGFETWQTLGNCFARLNRAEEAEKAYLEAVKLNKDSERPYLGLGSVAMLQSNWTAAQYSFMAALAKNPKTSRGEFGVGISLAAREKHAEALDYFKHVLSAEPDNAEALFYLYRSAMESGRPQAALDELDLYVRNHPNDTDFLFNYGGALWKSGELSSAIEVCEQILEIDPNHTQAKEALDHMRKAIAEHV